MWIVGMTGGIGSGKSEAAKAFSALGVPVVDVDKISHHLTQAGQPTLNKIVHGFGREILTKEGNLNRALLRQKIFESTDAKTRLEEIVHPAIYDEVLKQLAQNTSAPYQILDIPLLFESERYLKLINRSLVIDCEPTVQIARTMNRSGLNEDDVKKIMATQIAREKRSQLADDILMNNGSLSELKTKVAQLHEKYINTCAIGKLNT